MVVEFEKTHIRVLYEKFMFRLHHPSPQLCVCLYCGTACLPLLVLHTRIPSAANKCKRDTEPIDGRDSQAEHDDCDHNS